MDDEWVWGVVGAIIATVVGGLILNALMEKRSRRAEREPPVVLSLDEREKRAEDVLKEVKDEQFKRFEDDLTRRPGESAVDQNRRRTPRTAKQAGEMLDMLDDMVGQAPRK